MQNLAFAFVEACMIGLSPLIQAVQIALKSLSTLKQISTMTQLDIVHRLTESALYLLIKITDKGVKQKQHQYQALRKILCWQFDLTSFTIMIWDIIQPMLYSEDLMPVQAMKRQFSHTNTVGNSVKGFTEVEVNIHSLFFTHRVSHFVHRRS